MRKHLLFLFALVTMAIQAQTPGDIAQNFGKLPGFNGPIYRIATQTDGKIIVGGNFTSYQGATANYIIRLNVDGSKDTSFNTGTGFNSVVKAITIQSDGKILVGGNFNTYQGTTENRIIRLNADGSKDTSFNSGTGFSGFVDAITTQSDGKIIIGGGFNTYQGTTENCIIRLNADGSKDTSFNIGTGFNFAVHAITLQSDGKMIVGGQFTTYQGTTANYIILLNADGSKDTAFNTGTGFNGIVFAITTQSDGKILVGGDFTTYQGTTENRIIRLNTDGSKDTTFNTGTEFNNSVYAITTQSDGKILIGGEFTAYQGTTANSIIRLNADGSKDNSLTISTGFNNNVRAITIQSDGKILVGGGFATYQGTTVNRIIRLNADGSKDTAFVTGTGFNAYVLSIAPQTDGKIVVGGFFTTYNGVTEKYIIRLNADGSKDATFVTGTGFNNIVRIIAPQTDGKILVGGDFTTYNGVTEKNIIRLNANGSKDATFVTGTGFNNIVNSIAPQTDGKILVGGLFTSFKGSTENRIIRLNTDGSKDATFVTGTGFNGLVYSIAVQTDGKIVVGGTFTTYNGVTENYIIRLNADGSKDATFVTGTGFNDFVNSIALQTDGKIVVGGNFTTYNGVAENYIIRLNADGSKDATFVTGTGFNSTVNSIAPQTDGKILVGGSFFAYKGVAENRIIRLNANGNKDATFVTGTGFNSTVNSIAPQTDGKILVGGEFITYKGDNSSVYLIGLHSEISLGTPSFDAANAFVIYPNPVQDVLHLQANNFTSIKAVKIYDLQGKVVLQDTNDTINVSNLSNGLYIIKVTTEEGEFTKKFMKE